MVAKSIDLGASFQCRRRTVNAQGEEPPPLSPLVPPLFSPNLPDILCWPRAEKIPVPQGEPRPDVIRSSRRFVTVLTITAMVTPAVAPVRPALALDKTQYEACTVQNEEGFRKAVETLTLAALAKGLKDLDYRALIGDSWRRTGMDALVDKQVDEAVEAVTNETSILERSGTIFSQEKAKAMATTLSERVFRSDGFKKALEGLANDASKDIGKRIELATSDAAEPAMECVRAFLGPRYGSVVAGSVGEDARREFMVDPNKAAAEISTGRMVLENSKGIAGAVVILVRNQLARMAERVGQRVVGAVLSRLVGMIAGGIGAILIAKDVWDLRNGVLPTIASEMKSRATKDTVQEQVASAISEQIGENIKDIAAKTADRVVEVWRQFRNAHAKVLDLAEQQPRFKAFLDTVKADQMPRLDETVALVLANEGEAGVLKRLSDGTLHSAVALMPAAAFEIARETRSLETAFGWQAVAGRDIEKVKDLEIYRKAAPADFTKASLGKLLAVEDRIAILRLASLKAADREVLSEVETGALRSLARTFDTGELASLAVFQTGLERGAAQRVMNAVAADPRKMKWLTKSYVRDALLRSQDQAAAVGVALRADAGPIDLEGLKQDFELMAQGRVSPILIAEVHPASVAALGVLALILLLMFKRLLTPRRARPAASVRATGPGGKRRA